MQQSARIRRDPRTAATVVLIMITWLAAAMVPEIGCDVTGAALAGCVAAELYPALEERRGKHGRKPMARTAWMLRVAACGAGVASVFWRAGGRITPTWALLLVLPVIAIAVRRLSDQPNRLALVGVDEGVPRPRTWQQRHTRGSARSWIKIAAKSLGAVDRRSRTAGFLLAPPAGLVLSVWYLPLTLSTTYASEFGISPTTVAAWFGSAPIIGMFAVYPLGGRWLSRRQLVPISMGAVAFAEIMGRLLPGSAGLVVQLCGSSVAFAPWAIQARFTDGETSDAGKSWGMRTTALWWGTAYGVMAVVLIAVGDLLRGTGQEQVAALGKLQEWWGLALLLALILCARLLPGEQVTWGQGNPWLEFLGSALHKHGARVLTVLAALGGAAISSSDGYVGVAMHQLGFQTPQVAWTSVSVFVGMVTFFINPERFASNRWLRRFGVGIAAGGAVYWLASCVPQAGGFSWSLFFLGRSGVEWGTSALTLVTQLDDEIAALIQLAKALGQLVALFGDAPLDTTLGWAGICGALFVFGVGIVLLCVPWPRRVLEVLRSRQRALALGWSPPTSLPDSTSNPLWRLQYTK